MATKEDLSLAQVTALVRLSKKLKNTPAPKQGVKGEKGEKGDRGEQGPQGERGKEGPKGDKGPEGSKGTQGEQGKTGEKGEKGTQILSGKSKPQEKEGDDGDFYVQKAPLTIYGPKRSTQWGTGIKLVKEEDKESKTSQLTKHIKKLRI